MAVGSAIEWTEATWNPTTGCTKVSPGCQNCYAERLAARLRAMGQRKYSRGFEYSEHPSATDLPLRWRKPRRIFVNSMSDMLHENAAFEFVGKCFSTMLRADWHDYQILTKRPDRMAEFSRTFARYFGSPIPNFIWMGTSVENKDYAYRIDDLRGVECETRFVSFEPLIGPVGKVRLEGVDWAIIGGESGRNFRPVKGEWIRDIIRQCKRQRVPVFFKQWRGATPKSGGRTIDGKQYDQYPQFESRQIRPGNRSPHGRPKCPKN